MRTHGWAGSAPTDDAAAIERILQGAVDLIEADEPVNVARLAKHVGITRQTLYRYFPDTLSILHAAAAAAADDLLAELSRSLAGVTDPREAVVEGIAVSYEQLYENKRFALLFDPAGESRPLEQVTSDAAIVLGRAIIDNVAVDWHTLGWSDADLDELVEMMLRMLQTLIIDPGDPPRSGTHLRDFLRRWVAPAVSVVPVIR